MDLSQYSPKIFDLKEQDFEPLALDVFHYQYSQNPVYKQYVDAIHVDPQSVQSLDQVPFMPIRFFKSHEIRTGHFEPMAVFESSGTTTTINSKHLVKDPGLYQESFTRCFEMFYGPVHQYCIIGLLPSYLERSHSSLIYMVNDLINKSGHAESGFYLEAGDKLSQLIASLEENRQKTILVGVTFALLDFAAEAGTALRYTVVMETGGMKGRRKEMVRHELHDILKKGFGVSSVHSEYGMTELLSQAYSKGEGIFHCPHWMKVMLRDDADPLSVFPAYKTTVQSGVINVIDLANIHSCSFIATDDAGRLYPDGSFEVLGRIDNSDLRGCSLLTV